MDPRMALAQALMQQQQGDRLLAPPRNPARLPPMWESAVIEAIAGPVQQAGQALRGELTNAEAQDFAMTAAMAALPMGRVGRAARAAKLPMDEASRMARAREMGFYTHIPLAHGTASDFRAFDPAKGGATSGAAPGQHGVWLEVRRGDSPIADEFAEKAAAKTGADPRVMPLLHRAEKPASIELTGDEKNHEIAATLAGLWDDSFDSAMLRNYTSPGGKSGDILIVKDANQLRSPFAAFDPAKKNSRDLLASIAGLPPAAAALASALMANRAEARQ